MRSLAMSLRSQIFTRTTLWSVPATVSLVYATWVGSGGGGGGNTDPFNAGAGAGAGAGEFRHMFPVPVTPGGTLLVVIGNGGIPTSDTGPDGEPTIVGAFSALGGKGAPGLVPSNGGGPRGGTHPTIESLPGNAGSAESPTSFGGPSGGFGESAGNSGGGPGGQMIGQWSTARIANSTHHAGGSGGNSVFGAGGLGSNSGNGNNAGIGGGGGGSRGNAVVGDTAVLGGNGGAGYAYLIWNA